MKRATLLTLTMILCSLTWLSPSFTSTAGSALAAEKTGPKEASTDQKAQPEIAIPDPMFDFQNVVDGMEVVHDFPVYNRGAGDLAITKVQTG